ncbi:MFS transporter [Paraburkholderia phymatum]|uniref:MFS transporter n=1 Tax=Paraburkholderia phymatum TaxID=148447 RepID=UPI00316CE585
MIVACAIFMECVDENVIVTALPTMARDFGHDAVTLKVAVTSYAVGLGAFIPVCGWLADRFGARTVFRSAIGIFLVGSLLCVATNSLITFALARFVQGVGGAMMVPVGRIIIFRVVQRADIIRAMNYLSVPAMLGPAAGPLLGGLITSYSHWRLAFLVNVPISILGICLTNKHMANTDEPHPGCLDWTGFFLTGAGTALLLLGLSLIGSELISNRDACCMAVMGVVLLAGYVAHERRTPLPLLDLHFFDIPTFRASVLGGSLFRIGLGAMPFLLPLMLQEGYGMSAFESGLITCASALGAVFTRTVATRVLKRYGFRSVLVVNAALSGVSVAAHGFFSPCTPTWVIWVVVLVGGFFPALQLTTLNSLTYAEVASRDVGRATSLGSAVHRMSLGLSVTIGGIMLQISRLANGHASIMWSDFWPAFLLVSLCSLASIPVTLRLPRRAGEEITRASRI